MAASHRVFRNFKATASVRHFLARAPHAIAVALSGGPDSMALLYMLSQLVAQQKQKTKTRIHALIVDHGLRPESGAEAQDVKDSVASWPHVTAHILKWTGTKPDTGIMEGARDARYGRLYQWCKKSGIEELWLGHHATDQAETFLFRLAKGSGLDGLSVMGERRAYADTDLMLVRPLLALDKADIEDYCTVLDIPFVRDPSNQDLKYARARLRQSLPVLEEEGLSAARLATTARRLAQAREALDFYADKIIRSAAQIEPDEARVKIRALINAPAEMRVRVIRRLLGHLESGKGGYGPRLDRLEDLLESFFMDLGQAKRFTLGGYLFSHDKKTGMFVIRRQ